MTRKIKSVVVCESDRMHMHVKVTVEIDSDDLSQEEIQEANDSLVSGVMREIPTTQYLNARLCNVRVL